MTLSVCIYHADCKAVWSAPWLAAAEKGFLQHGITPKHNTYAGARHGIDCDLAVFWSHRQKGIIKYQLDHGFDYLVMERGYIGDRNVFSSIGFNGLNNRAEFHADNMPGDRWQKYFDGMLQPWKFDGGDYILLIGQVEGDESIRGRVVMNDWLQETADKLKERYPNDTVKFRPHPLSRQSHNVEGTIKSNSTLDRDLANAKMAVTFNSNVGVDAVLAGVPAIAKDRGSMIYWLATHEIDVPTMGLGRQQWANDMAYKQWTVEEVADGLAWDHLKVRYQ